MTDPRDYVAAKEAWEREHPGEVYTTAMHHSSGPRPRVLTDYWTQFDEAAPLACAACGWEGASEGRKYGAPPTSSSTSPVRSAIRCCRSRLPRGLETRGGRGG